MKNRNLKLILLDAVASSMALFLAFLIRFEFSIPENFMNLFYSWIPIFMLVQSFVFYFTGLYARIWRYTSLFDLYAIITSVAISCTTSFLLIFFTMGTAGYPRSVLILYFLLVKTIYFFYIGCKKQCLSLLSYYI